MRRVDEAREGGEPASEIRSRTDRPTDRRLPPRHPRNKRVATASIRQEFATFGMRYDASRFSLRSLSISLARARAQRPPCLYTVSISPLYFLLRIWTFPPCCPSALTPSLYLSFSLSLFSTLSRTLSRPATLSVVAVADTEGRQKAIGANGLVARTRRPFD